MMNGMWFGWIFLLVILGLIIWVAVTMVKKNSRVVTTEISIMKRMRWIF